MSIKYSYVTKGGVTNTRTKTTETSLEELAQTEPIQLSLTSVEYHNLEHTERAKLKKTLSYFVGGVIEGKRHDDNITSRTLLTLDIESSDEQDTQPPQPATVARKLQELGMEGWVHSTTSSVPACPRYHVILPLERPLIVEDKTTAYETLKASTLRAAELLEIDEWCKAESYKLSQPMYMPSKLKGGKYFSTYVEGSAWKTQKPAKKTVADIPDERPDTVLHAIKRAGLYLAPDKEKGRHRICCPWHDDHGTDHGADEHDTQTMYMEANFNGFPHASVQCFDTEPDVGDEKHLTYAKLVRWLKDGGHLSQEEQNKTGVLEEVESFLYGATTTGLFEGDIEPTDWVINELMPSQEVTVLAAPGGQGKSMLMLHLACYGAFGEAFGGFQFQEKTRTLYISYEDRIKTFKIRLRGIKRALEQHDNGRLDMLYNVEQHLGANVLLHTMSSTDAASWVLSTKEDRWGEPVLTPRVQWLIDVVRAGGIRLLVLDPLVYTHHLDENSNREMAVLMRALGRVAEEANCAVVVVHHMSKDGGWKRLNEVNAAGLRGASAVADNSRSSVVLLGLPREDAVEFGIAEDQAHQYAVCVHVKHTHNEHGPHPIQVFKRGGSGLTPAEGVQRMTKEQVAEARESAKQAVVDRRVEAYGLKVLDILLQHEGPMTQNQIGVELPKVSPGFVKRVLDCLEMEDFVSIEPGPNRSKQIEITALGKRFFQAKK